jgi:hypothetical protein
VRARARRCIGGGARLPDRTHRERRGAPQLVAESRAENPRRSPESRRHRRLRQHHAEPRCRHHDPGGRRTSGRSRHLAWGLATKRRDADAASPVAHAGARTRPRCADSFSRYGHDERTRARPSSPGRTPRDSQSCRRAERERVSAGKSSASTGRGALGDRRCALRRRTGQLRLGSAVLSRCQRLARRLRRSR